MLHAGNLREMRWNSQIVPEKYVAAKKRYTERRLKPEEGLEQIVDKVAMEAVLDGLPRDMRLWISRQRPSSRWFSVTLQTYLLDERTDRDKLGPNHDSNIQKFSRQTPYKHSKKGSDQTTLVKNRKDPKEITCYECGKKGHCMANCKEETYNVQFYTPKQSRFLQSGTVNESDVVIMKNYSGCTQTTVRRDVVPGVVLMPKTKKVLAYDGRALEHSLADINLTVGDICFEIEVIIAEDLVVPVLLGEDLPLEELVNEGKDGKNSPKETGESMAAVLTRTQKLEQEEEKPVNRWLLTKLAQRARQMCRRYRLMTWNQNLILLMTYFVLRVRIEDDSQNLKNGSRLKDEPPLGSERKVNMAQEQKEDDEVQKWKSQEKFDRVINRNGVLLTFSRPSRTSENCTTNTAEILLAYVISRRMELLR